MNISRISKEDARFPEALRHYLRTDIPDAINVMGNPDLLGNRLTALFCSVRCPGRIILHVYDTMQALMQAGLPVISGFHSPVERECLRILLRGRQPVIVCPARRLTDSRIPAEHKKAFEEGRLLFLSPFDENQRRPTVETSLRRNRFVAALAVNIIVPYAEPGSKTELFCKEILAWGKRLYTFGSDANTNLMELGASPVTPGETSDFIGNLPR